MSESSPNSSRLLTRCLLWLRGPAPTRPWVWSLWRLAAGWLLWLNHLCWRGWRARGWKRTHAGPFRLHLGCGPYYLPGWLNIDWLPVWKTDAWLDARQGLPFPSGFAQEIYTKEMLEHLPADAIIQLLAECHRVLAPGGRLWIAVPGFEQTLVAYQQRQKEAFAGLPSRARWKSLAAVAGDFLLCDGHHRSLLDGEFLQELLRAAGAWESITLCTPESCPPLSQSMPADAPGRSLLLVVETVK